jgi:hypothetical protein
MPKSFPSAAIAAIALALLIRVSRGDGDSVDGEEAPIDDTTEPITGDPVMPTPGSEQPMKDPFVPYDIGGPAAAWRLEDLHPEEQVVALRGLDDEQAEVQDAWAQAAHDLATTARAERAALAIGLENSASLGVVP